MELSGVEDRIIRRGDKTIIGTKKAKNSKYIANKINMIVKNPVRKNNFRLFIKVFFNLRIFKDLCINKKEYNQEVYQ